MITFTRGNILEADTEALVNTVNTVGVMGKGIALQFRQAFPDNYRFYRSACARNDVQLGRMCIFRTGRLENPRYIVNFPTKRHWRDRSRLGDIEAGLRDLRRFLSENCVRSVALPPLGCGNGGLDWPEVRPLIDQALGGLVDILVRVYEPIGAPAADSMRVTTSRPTMTASRAALVAVLALYDVPGYRLSMLEVQKLAYLLQEAGEPLRLQFTRNAYGPYAEALHHVLQRIEGHFIRGYGDRSSHSSMYVLPWAAEEARRLLSVNSATSARQQRVADLISGFETPYGMELLATVQWLARADENVRQDADAAVAAVHGWSSRKRDVFQPAHIRRAWRQLYEQNWLQQDSAMALPRTTPQ